MPKNSNFQRVVIALAILAVAATAAYSCLRLCVKKSAKISTDAEVKIRAVTAKSESYISCKNVRTVILIVICDCCGYIMRPIVVSYTH
jgi:hypothetical protein